MALVAPARSAEHLPHDDNFTLDADRLNLFETPTLEGIGTWFHTPKVGEAIRCVNNWRLLKSISRQSIAAISGATHDLLMRDGKDELSMPLTDPSIVSTSLGLKTQIPCVLEFLYKSYDEGQVLLIDLDRGSRAVSEHGSSFEAVFRKPMSNCRGFCFVNRDKASFRTHPRAMQDTESVANQEISELICQQLNRSNESFDCFSGAYIASSAVLRHIKVSRLKDDFVPADGVHAALAGAAVQAARRSSLAVTSIEVPFLDYESFTGVNGDISKMFSSVDSSAEQARRNRMRDEWPVVFKRFLTDPTVLW